MENIIILMNSINTKLSFSEKMIGGGIKLGNPLDELEKKIKLVLQNLEHSDYSIDRSVISQTGFSYVPRGSTRESIPIPIGTEFLRLTLGVAQGDEQPSYTNVIYIKGDYYIQGVKEDGDWEYPFYYEDNDLETIVSIMIE
jgi:hypothetical protein